MTNWTANEWLELSNIAFTLLGIAVSALVAYWIVISIQKRISNDQSFKVYLTDSLQNLKNSYYSSLMQLVNGKVRAKDVSRDLNAYEKRIHENMRLITTKYEAIDEKYFDPWMIVVRSTIESMDEFADAYQTNKLVRLTPEHQNFITSKINELDELTNKFIVLLFKQ